MTSRPMCSLKRWTKLAPSSGSYPASSEHGALWLPGHLGGLDSSKSDPKMDIFTAITTRGSSVEPRPSGPKLLPIEWEQSARGAELAREQSGMTAFLGVKGSKVQILECECAWEPEHGLQIVFRRGCSVSKVGPFDSHLTNVSAFALPTVTW
ncbi:DUF6985 domain-containing protein [Streptacidiphilus pinicola]|uniref:DUF6985 domain-containing protein n=1 Tax=Streptacidiphilus pinicola TaxID=2219663 RepID=UPI003C74A005